MEKIQEYHQCQTVCPEQDRHCVRPYLGPYFLLVGKDLTLLLDQWYFQ